MVTDVAEAAELVVAVVAPTPFRLHFAVKIVTSSSSSSKTTASSVTFLGREGIGWSNI